MALTFRHTVEFSKNKHTPSRTTKAVIRSGMNLPSSYSGLVLDDLGRSSYEPGD
jgi:hypothetical protein